jgi:hypothetical protein
VEKYLVDNLLMSQNATLASSGHDWQKKVPNCNIPAYAGSIRPLLAFSNHALYANYLQMRLGYGDAIDNL